MKSSARHPPDARGAVKAGGGDALAVGEKRYAGHHTGVTFVLAQLRSGLRVPNAHCVVVTAGSYALAVRRNRDATGLALVLAVGRKTGINSQQFLARLDVQD